MTAGTKMIEGLAEAIEVAKGEKPAYKLHWNGKTYVSEDRFVQLIAERDDLTRQLAEAVEVLHRISLGSQNSGTTKEDLGHEARAFLQKQEARK